MPIAQPGFRVKVVVIATTLLDHITPATPITEVAQDIVDAHIHRVLVVRDEQPFGIITSTDLMAAIAKTGR